MQRLSGLDAVFFYLETPSTHMHVAGVYVLEPGEVDTSFEAIRTMVRERLPLAAPFRRRLVEVPFKLAHPLWVEDPAFDLDYHVRRAALPAPGGRAELEAFVAQAVGLPLDRTRPLWEMYVVEGLEDGRIAVLTKIHHAAIDGVSGAEIAASWLDLERDPPPRSLTDEWRPEAVPSELEMVALTVASLAANPFRVVRTARRLLESAVHLTERGSGPSPAPFPFTAPKTSLNQAITPHRRVAAAEVPLEDVKVVKNHFSCTVNDVLLAVCAGALRRYLEAGDELPEEALVALVPMSVRAEEENGTLGNRVTPLLASLATDVEDPAARLRAIAGSMRAAKEQDAGIGAALLSDWSLFTFPALIGRASRLVSSTRVFDRVRPAVNVAISNVPGPGFPLFFAGRRVEAFFPFGPVAEGIGLNITVLSYCGTLYFGLNACRETVPRLAELPAMIEDALGELHRLATSGRETRGGPRRRKGSTTPAVARDGRIGLG